MEKLAYRVFSDSRLIDLFDSLLPEQELKLKSLLLMYLIMTEDTEDIYELAYELYPLVNDENVRFNNGKYLSMIVDFILSKGYNPEEILNKYINDGYLFHSFNKAFYKSIASRGLIVKDKPWDLLELERIKQIFASHGKKDIFGLYQGEEKTPIYLSTSIGSSSYYGISSPTWFLHFTTGGMSNSPIYDKEAFRNRDYASCHSNVVNLIKEYNLTLKESEIVMDFFNKYYQIYGNKEKPNVLLVKRSYLDNKKEIKRLENESDKDFMLRTLTENCSGNKTVKTNIPKEDIVIIDYSGRERKYSL